MCKDEYLMLMTWKKTAAGEIIYNKCPPNATGDTGCPQGWSGAGWVVLGLSTSKPEGGMRGKWPKPL